MQLLPTLIDAWRWSKLTIGSGTVWPEGCDLIKTWSSAGVSAEVSAHNVLIQKR